MSLTLCSPSHLFPTHYPVFLSPVPFPCPFPFGITPLIPAPCLLWLVSCPWFLLPLAFVCLSLVSVPLYLIPCPSFFPPGPCILTLNPSSLLLFPWFPGSLVPYTVVPYLLPCIHVTCPFSLVLLPLPPCFLSTLVLYDLSLLTLLPPGLCFLSQSLGRHQKGGIHPPSVESSPYLGQSIWP